MNEFYNNIKHLKETKEETIKESFDIYLEKEYQRRKEVNPSYSMRAFAKLIGVDQSTLSKFFKRERNFTWATMNRCLERLSANKELIEHYKQEKSISENDEFIDIEEDHLNLIADWRCWAAIEYLKVDPLATMKSIAKNFDAPEEDMKDAINRMIRLGYLGSEDGVFKIIRRNNALFSNENTTIARKELQKDLMGISIKALEDVRADYRYHGSMTIAIDIGQLPEIKEKLNSLQVQFAKYLQKNSYCSDVYQLTLSFFPLTVNEDRKEEN